MSSQAVRRRAIGPLEILIVLGLVTVLAGIAWTKLGPKHPTPTAVEAVADQLAIDLLRCHREAIMKQATFAVTIMPGSSAGPGYYAISRPLGPSLEEPLREFSLPAGISISATPARIEFRPDGAATSDWQVDLTAPHETRTVTVTGPTGVVRILPADGAP
ncbi:MAG: hypothetical protein KF708_11695 [Pirellulales bacterium]|nr:hypothetical protein [Pirellulales bacterium]